MKKLSNKIKSRRSSVADEVAELLQKHERRMRPNGGIRRSDAKADDGVRYEVLGSLCAQRRDAENLSLRDVTALTGISASALSRVENGKVINTGNAIALSRWLGVSLGAIAGAAPEDSLGAVNRILLGDPRLGKVERKALSSIFSILYRRITD